jgi:molecular chaperone DnaK
MGKIIGIDLGTTNSVVAIMEGREPKVIVNEEGSRTTPSVVAWDDKGEVLVGQIAKRQAVTNPENTIFSAKRFIGRRFEEVTEEIKRVPYKVVRAPNGDCAFVMRGKQVSPPEVSAHVLMKLKKAAEDYLGEKVTEAVITVPAYFNDAQRQGTKDAGRIAGLDVKRIVNEPTAAALAYGLDKKKDEVISVYDFGGGTFDISILEVGDNVVQVISTNGDTHLGGDDIDNMIIDWMVAEFKKSNAVDLRNDKMALQRLREAAEKAKIELSSVQETGINLPYITVGAGGPMHLDMRLPRAKLEQMITPLVERAMEPVRKALADAKKSPKDIDEVVLVGGSTRIPLVQETVKKFFGKEPHKGVNPDEVVAVGAAVQAGVLSGDVKDLVLLDVTPLSLGVETLGGVMTTMIPRNTTIPTQKKEIFSTGKDQKITITANSGLNEQQIQNMVKEAQEHEREDKERREQIERRNKLDNLCYTIEKTLNDNRDKIQGQDLSVLEALIKEGREAVTKQDDDKVQDVTARLEKEAHRLAGIMYGTNAPPGAGGPGAGGTNGGPSPAGEGDKKGKDGGVIDAEFEETGG